ncbi:MAG: PocR ligand-binding domain-containing protein [Peptococcaceae bacterium]|nr:PocR ligand-binding domain-containing protein [Peptococcaceae bacterium]
MEGQNDNLLQLIEQDKLIDIIKNFTQATDITIDINDAQGYPVVKHDYFYGFCQAIRSTSRGLERCICSNADLGLQTVKAGDYCMGKCHAGVMLMSVPIVVEEQFWGSITCGQMHLTPPEPHEIAAMLMATADLGLEAKLLERSFQEIKIISMDRCQAAGGLIQVVVNYIVELVYRSKMQEELSRQKLKTAEEARIIEELEHTLHKAELKTLQAQIKPHFLFNTLNTITGLITLGEHEKGVNTLYALSNLLRHNLDRPGEMVTVQDEINYVENYLLIQKNRFGAKLRVSIAVPPELLRLRIPFLSLQPLTENACVHGLEPKETVGNLTIRGQINGTQAEIAVCDDGVGWRDATDTVATPDQIKCGIGLHNVHRRLQLQFGSAYGIRMSSQQGRTTVSLIIPVDECPTAYEEA